jgi:short-subunit dehydrogenase
MSGHKKTALVTGASSGLGAEFCRQLSQQCEVIIAVARRAERLEALASELEGRAEVHVIQADLRTIEGVARTVEAIRQKGPVDCLVNNAGFATQGSFDEAELQSQHDMVAVHINATLSLCRAAIPFMRELGAGQIVNVSSLGAFLPGRGLVTYGATKAFLNHYSQGLQMELAGSGIAVQVLCPGYTRTEFHMSETLAGFDTEKIPAQYWMDSSVVVAASLAAMETGQMMVVPGDGNLAMAKAGLDKYQASLEA